MTASNDVAAARSAPSCWAVFLVFLRLGLTSFGGPVAHLGYFREEFVIRRRWLSEPAYAELVSICQFLPGPASSQVGMALGLSRAGYRGALAAWVGFTLPSVILLAVLGVGMSDWLWTLPAGVVHGLKLVAVAVVAQAVWGMARSLCGGALRKSIALIAAAVTLAWPGTAGQLAAMLLAAAVGTVWLHSSAPDDVEGLAVPISRRAARGWLLLLALLFVGLPLLVLIEPSTLLALAERFFRTGALVFGGGHVVLPLLQQDVVAPGWLANDVFLAGYAAAQAVPGPLFTFAAFLGGALHGWSGALVAVVAIFLPSFLLVVGVLPYWQSLRRLVGVGAAVAGVNAAVVGLLLASLYRPLVTETIHGVLDALWVLVALVALMRWRCPPWMLVLVAVLLGAVADA